jgi:hypothetical protein
MRLFIYKIRDKLRTMAGIRVERQVPPPSSEKPTIGSNIVREKLRIRLKYPIHDDLWKFFTAMGWRTVDMRLNRRRYTVVPDKVLLRFIKSNEIERHVLHARLVKPGKRNSDAHHAHSDTDAPFVKTSRRKFGLEKNMAE